MFKIKSDNSEIKNYLNQSNSKQGSNVSYDSLKNTDNSLINFRVKSANVNSNSFNKQSPKFKSGFLRENNKISGGFNYLNEVNENFSMLDVPNKKVARGTIMPIQYKKLTQKEIEENYTTRKMKENKKEMFKLNNPNDKEDPHSSIIPEHNHLVTEDYENLDKIPKIKSEKSNPRFERKIKTAKPFENKLNLLQLKETITIKNDNFTNKDEKDGNKYDPWMPANLREYERNIKTAHTHRQDHQYYKDIQKYMKESNVFFTKNVSSQSAQSEQAEKIFSSTSRNFYANCRDYRQSDLFNTKSKNCEINPLVSKKFTYCVSTRSNSEWNDKISNPSLLNHTSVRYHILNPDIKHIFKTKEDIVKSTQFNPVHRQKSLCEYRDLTRVGQPNINRDYRVAVNKSPNIFNRNSNICANFMDIHRGYKNLIDPPFTK